MNNLNKILTEYKIHAWNKYYIDCIMDYVNLTNKLLAKDYEIKYNIK